MRTVIGVDGSVRIATSDDTLILGYVTRIHGPKSLAGVNSTFKVQQTAADKDVVTLTTSYRKAAPAA